MTETMRVGFRTLHGATICYAESSGPSEQSLLLLTSPWPESVYAFVGLAQRMPEVETPVQIIAGRRDRVVPLANAEFLDDR
jgi:hypothetical protein